ncbi:ABC transporter substrate-binding protein [Parapedobacter deserti]|uniref:ABC transporter substrate-binding protein n=1 Tax=Parapedobacter deserti TaxID=1912957 RepID=A0ABV7JEN9_9SPHI
MQKPLISLRSIIQALDLDLACITLLEQGNTRQSLLPYRSPETVYTAIQTIGQQLNVRQQADQLVEDLEERTNIIRHKLKFIPAEDRPKLWLLQDVSPLEDAGNEYLSNLVTIAGGIVHSAAASDGQRPDSVIIITDQPIPQLLNRLPEALASNESLQTAAENKGIYLIHNSNYLRQPGAQIADDAEILAEILHPKYFVFGRDKDVWMKFDWQ